MTNITDALLDDSVLDLGALAFLMGMDWKERQVAPPLTLMYSTVNADDNLVNGHRNRSEDFAGYWYYKYEIDFDLSPIAIVDNAPFLMPRVTPYKSFLVTLSDIPTKTCYETPDICINYQIGAKKLLRDYKNNAPAKDYFLGEKYFFTRSMEDIDGFPNSPEPNVLVVPNGNKELFMESIDLRAIHRLIEETGGGSLTVVNNLDKDIFLDFVDLSSIVITTPSVTAMECLSIGIPVLLIPTSIDHTGKFVDAGFAEWYSLEALKSLLQDVNKRMSVKKIGNNIDLVTSLVYNKWLEWRKK